MPCGILHPMVWSTSMNSLALILKTIDLFLSCKLIFWKATKVGNPPYFPKLMSQLWGITQPQYFVTSLLEPHRTYFWKHYIYRKEDTKVGSQNFATKFGVAPDCSYDRVPKLPFCMMSLKIIVLKSLLHLPGVNNLIQNLISSWFCIYASLKTALSFPHLHILPSI